jgi:hypothetical protein
MQKDASSFNFSSDKNNLLIKERNISFEEIIAAIENGNTLGIIEHPNKRKYGHQKMYIVHAGDYVYLVPFVLEQEGGIFLKTIIPSRKAKKQYLGNKEN